MAGYTDHVAGPTHRRAHFAAGTVGAISDQPPNVFESLASLAYAAGSIVGGPARRRPRDRREPGRGTGGV